MIVSEWLQSWAAWLRTDGEMVRFATMLGVLTLLGILEVVVPAFQHPPERGQRWLTNFSLALINIALLSLAPITALWAAEWAQNEGVGLLNHMHVLGFAALVSTLAVRSLAGYVVHVLMHKVPLLWRLHRVHHLDTHIDVSTTLRSHPVEMMLIAFIMVPVAIIFGLSPWALVLYEGIELLVSLISHANLRLSRRLDQILRWVLVTPNMHSIHHSAYQPDTDSNYGSVFTLWDRLFGTYKEVPVAGYENMQIGLREVRDERASDLWWQIKSPTVRTLRSR